MGSRTPRVRGERRVFLNEGEDERAVAPLLLAGGLKGFNLLYVLHAVIIADGGKKSKGGRPHFARS